MGRVLAELRKTIGESLAEFRDDPYFKDCDLIGYQWKLKSAVEYVARNFPEYDGVKRRLAIRNTFLALGGGKKETQDAAYRGDLEGHGRQVPDHGGD